MHFAIRATLALQNLTHMNTSESTQWDRGMATGQDTPPTLIMAKKRWRSQMYARWLLAFTPAALDDKTLNH